MNALVIASPPQVRTAPPGEPWRNMIWVTWRQHRVAILAMLGLLAAVVALMVFTGLRNRAAYAPLLAHPDDPNLFNALSSRTDGLTVLVMGLHAVPVLVGLFVGAPLVAREFESGTYQFAWTQGAGRSRLVIARLVLLGGAMAIASCVLGILAGWWFQLFNAVGLESPWLAGQFDLTGVMLASWTVFAFAAGAFAGTLLRRTVPAMAATTGLVAALAVVGYWKLDYLLRGIAPVRLAVPPGAGGIQGAINTYASRGSAGPAGSWLLQGWYTDSGGHELSSRAAVLLRYRLNDLKGQVPLGPWLREHHLSYEISYQPGGRFWFFQGIEGAVLLVLAGLLGWATLRWVRVRG
jgi:ABC-type transport system involved in multi-copper enzyme maturation permease subunit